MPPVITKQRECPVCGDSHAARTASGVDWIACPKITPAGNTLTYPLMQLQVLGAGIGVDEPVPLKEPAADKAARLSALEQQLFSIQEREKAAERDAKLDERLAQVEAELATKKKGKE